VKKNYWEGGGIFAAFLCRQTQGPVLQFEIRVLTVVRIKIALFLDMTSFSLAEKCQNFGRNIAFNSYPGSSRSVVVYHITGLRMGNFSFSQQGFEDLSQGFKCLRL
jgi:hypothetical protein